MMPALSLAWRRRAVAVAVFAAMVPMAAHAHRMWLAPSTTFIETDEGGKPPVITVDGAVSEDLFEFDSFPLALDAVRITAPDGTTLAADAVATGRRRSGFEFVAAQPGTYRVANVSDQMMANYKVGGEQKRWRGSADALAGQIPADAQDVQVTRMRTRVETFVTYGSQGGKAFTPVGSGLELIPLTAPTDLNVGDRTRFRLLKDGQPLPDAEIIVIRGGNRYRYKIGELSPKSDASGEFTIAWPEAGRWWIGIVSGARGPGSAGTVAAPAQRLAYTATVEVLPK